MCVYVVGGDLIQYSKDKPYDYVMTDFVIGTEGSKYVVYFNFKIEVSRFRGFILIANSSHTLYVCILLFSRYGLLVDPRKVGASGQWRTPF